MWNSNMSPEMRLNKSLVDAFKKYAKFSGVVFIIMGLVGILYPTLMTVSTVVFVAYLMLVAGLYGAWMTWKSNRKDWTGWLKSFALLFVSLMMLFYPMEGVATLGLLLAVYFFMDAFASMGLAFSLKPDKIWWLWFFNALTSLVLGVLFLVNWPLSSLFLIGLLVGISLLFDGIALLFGGMFFAAREDENSSDQQENKK